MSEARAAQASPRPPGLQRAEDLSEQRRAAARRIIIFCAALLILYYLLFLGFSEVPEAQALFLPSMLLGACLLLASLSSLLLVGFLVPHLRAGLRWLGMMLFIGLILVSLNGVQPGLSLVGGMVMGLGALVFLACLAHGYSEHLWIVLRAVAFVLMGLVLRQAAVVLASRLDQLDAALLLAFAAVGLLSLIGLLYAHQNPALSSLGGFFRLTLNLMLLGVLGSLLTLYLMVFRPLLQVGYEAYVVLIEWLAVGILASVIGIRFYLYFRQRSGAPVMGDWTVLVQKVSFEEGDLRRATAAVRDFIDQGRKEGVVVLLTSTLLLNQMPEERIEQILRRIINYQPPSFALLFRWTYGDRERKLREERAQMVMAALQETAEAVDARYLSSGLHKGREQRAQEA